MIVCDSSVKSSTRRSRRTGSVVLPALMLIAAITASCSSSLVPTSHELLAAARSYWTDVSLRTAESMDAAYVYLDDRDKVSCSEGLFERSADDTSRFSDVQISDPVVDHDTGSVRVTVTYLVVGFMERDPDLPTSTYASDWQWDGSRWRIVSPVGCIPSG